ncbi:protein TRM32 [Humulus lupulus]|uniref:protein TRM32 n=1 Tax=Humulus lupulus TaxID=3486 RepID=UPI002B40CA73|nr:protein TRM32 [Humulus lupulus]
MGKHLQRNDSIVDGNYPGCLCGIMHFLDHHHWQSVKKLMPHKKNGGKRRIKHNGNKKRISKNSGSDEVFIIDTADAEPFLVRQQSTDSVPASRSGRSRVKPHRGWILSFPMRSWLQRANPVHHSESSENYLGHTGTGKGKPDTVSDIVNDSNISQDIMKDSQLSTNISNQNHLNDCVDILEIFKVNKEFFLKLLQGPDVRKNQFHGLKNSNIKVRLTKSRSFPVPNSSQTRNIRPSTLKHKQNEVWFFLNGEKAVAGTQALKLEGSEFQKDHYTKSTTADGDTIDSVNSHGWNQLVLNRFRIIKQKIKQALKESKTENGHTPEASYQGDIFGGRNSIDGREMSERLEITIGQDDNKNDDLRRRRLHRVRRTSSLNESLDRYTQLFENTLGSRVVPKYSHSRSLRVTVEEKVTSNTRKSCRRNLSLPDLAFSSFLNGTSHDAPFRLGMPIKTLVDHRTSKDRDNQSGPYHSEPLEAVLEIELQRSESSENFEYSDSLTVNGSEKRISITDANVKDEDESATATARESRDHQEEEISVTMDPKEELLQANYESVIENRQSNDLTSSTEFLTSEDPEFSLLQEDITEIKITTGGSNLSCRFESEMTENAEFNYVQFLLHVSGFTVNDEQDWAWHSLDQPLSPSLFKEMEEEENCFGHDLIISEEEEVADTASFISRHILFDLVNETLGKMIEKSYTYFPREFSFGSTIRRTHKGQHLVEEVWERTNKSLTLRPELDQTLDDVVARDLAKGQGWMHVQWESETVALELEDLIFDQLLDEIIF